VHCSSKKCGFAVNLNSHEAAKPPESGAAPVRREQCLMDRRATCSGPPPQARSPAAEGRKWLRRLQSRGFETVRDRPRAHPLALRRPGSRTMRRSLAGKSCAPMEPEAKTVKVGGSSGGVPPLLGTPRARSGQPARRAGGVPPPLVVGQGLRARLAGEKAIQPTVRPATLLPLKKLQPKSLIFLV
jgi:hypothetical protein